jgi:hypothetical protein
MYTLSSWDMKSQRQNSDHCPERHLGIHSGLATPMKAGPAIDLMPVQLHHNEMDQLPRSVQGLED